MKRVQGEPDVQQLVANSCDIGNMGKPRTNRGAADSANGNNHEKSLSILRDAFPEWPSEDLVEVLKSARGNVDVAAERIASGVAGRPHDEWKVASKKAPKKPREEAPRQRGPRNPPREPRRNEPRRRPKPQNPRENPLPQAAKVATPVRAAPPPAEEPKAVVLDGIHSDPAIVSVGSAIPPSKGEGEPLSYLAMLQKSRNSEAVVEKPEEPLTRAVGAEKMNIESWQDKGSFTGEGLQPPPMREDPVLMPSGFAVESDSRIQFGSVGQSKKADTPNQPGMRSEPDSSPVVHPPQYPPYMLPMFIPGAYDDHMNQMVYDNGSAPSYPIMDSHFYGMGNPAMVQGNPAMQANGEAGRNTPSPANTQPNPQMVSNAHPGGDNPAVGVGHMPYYQGPVYMPYQFYGQAPAYAGNPARVPMVKSQYEGGEEEGNNQAVKGAPPYFGMPMHPHGYPGMPPSNMHRDGGMQQYPNYPQHAGMSKAEPHFQGQVPYQGNNM